MSKGSERSERGHRLPAGEVTAEVVVLLPPTAGRPSRLLLESSSAASEVHRAALAIPPSPSPLEVEVVAEESSVDAAAKSDGDDEEWKDDRFKSDGRRS